MTPHPRRPGQHRAVVAEDGTTLSEADRPEPGPIAVLPRPRQLFVDAVNAGGGTVAELDDDTRGLIWLSYTAEAELREALNAHPKIGWVQLPYAGVDAFADVLASQKRRSLVWTSAKGAFAEPVAEHALALTLALLRVLPKRVVATSWSTVPRGARCTG